jgi:hypothetical protein
VCRSRSIGGVLYDVRKVKMEKVVEFYVVRLNGVMIIRAAVGCAWYSPRR